MTNDNNKINKLVLRPDDDPKMEAESSGSSAGLRRAVSKDTGDIDESGELSVTVLKSNLISSAEHIDNLQAEIEQVRNHSRKLELELESYGNTGQGSDSDTDDVEARLRSAQTELDARGRDLVKMEEKLNKAVHAARKSTDEREQIRRAAKNDHSRVYELEKQLKLREKRIASAEKRLKDSLTDRDPAHDVSIFSDTRIAEIENQLAQSQTELHKLHHYVERHRSSWSQRKSELAQARISLASAEHETEKLSLQVEESNDGVGRKQTEIEMLSAQLGARIDECERLRDDNRAFRRELEKYYESKIEGNEKLIAKQSGLLSGYAQEIRELTTRIGGTEKYADDLRRQLGARSEFSERTVNSNQCVQVALETAQRRIRDLSGSLQESERQTAELTGSAQDIEKKHAEESRQLRLELESTRESVAEQTSINRRLLSDLNDVKRARQALETKLSDTEDRFDKEVRYLELKASLLQNQADLFERKLKNRDDAIAALMNELANRSSKFESISAIDDVIAEKEDRESGPSRDQTQSGRSRITRLFVRKTDGQELRFPLFKNRLTIGRTANNDIQLEAQFISRRHAVIVTENNGTRIVDWGSRNGVFINDQRVVEQILKNGDVVTIGTTDFRYEERMKR